MRGDERMSEVADREVSSVSSDGELTEPSVRSRRGRRLVIAWLLSIHAVLMVHCAVEDFVTYDEIGNLAAGVAYWKHGSYHLYSVNPPLTKLLLAAPVVLARPDTDGLATLDVPGVRDERVVGERFALANAEHYHGLVVLARLVGVGWSLLGAWLVYRWAGELWGVEGGLLAMSIWCFEPNIITHGHLLNADLPATVAALAAGWTLRGFLQAPSWHGAYIAGLVLGVAQLCKFTLVVLYPVWLVLWAVYWASTRGAARPRALAMAFLLVTSLLVVNLGYEFAGTGQRLEDYPFVSQTFRGASESESGGRHGNRFRGTWLGRLPVPVPESYVRGIDVQRRDFEIYHSRYSYLGGRWVRGGGWWHYYLYAAAVKVPLGFWGLLLMAMFWPWRGRWAIPWRGDWRELLMLGLPALTVLVLVSSQRSLQSHFRYVLAVFPFVIVFAGRVGALFGRTASRIDIPVRRGKAVGADGQECPFYAPMAADCPVPTWPFPRWARGLVVGLLVWALGSYLFVHPYSLGYFNELAGGPHGGHHHLLGSNIDWGQDLYRLRRWLDRHPEAAADLQMAYFNRIDARIAGLEWRLPPLGVTEDAEVTEAKAGEFGPHPGHFAVSIRFVRGNQAGATDGEGGYRFRPFRSYEYFQHFQPVAKAGYSIFLYHITPDQANAIRAQYGLPPLPEG